MRDPGKNRTIEKSEGQQGIQEKRDISKIRGCPEVLDFIEIGEKAGHSTKLGATEEFWKSGTSGTIRQHIRSHRLRIRSHTHAQVPSQTSAHP